ncbi:DUF4006 family protein [Candidatus Sulfurimonas marisnigri]|uniref:DUF4006 family protein n=1 Tax=Candidatus Sulfurimonas marisnigri TaxID=2740405 RepID=A0A7S7LZU9_9BACT|nr:DUF4006 family protein [Candidatus Sulfurimonas marisnigri]QOY54497.1 DUF4006 family protein [Candidatus Sulfurimonas marisnigri]
MNENRSVFALDGITGMLIATVLLLTILIVLSAWGLSVQNASATNFYEVKDEKSIKMFGSKVEDHIVNVGSK